MEPLEHALGLRVGRLADLHLRAEHPAERLAVPGQLGLPGPPPADRALPVPHQRLRAPRRAARQQLPPARVQVLGLTATGSAPRRATASTPTPSSSPAAASPCGSGRTRPAARSAGNQKSNCASSPASYVVREAGSGGRYAGRSSRTRSFNTGIQRSHPTRSAITVAGIVGTACSCSRIRGSNASTADPAGVRTYLGGPSPPAPRDRVLEHPNVLAITLIGIPSARCNRRISAQSSTDNTRFLLPRAEVRVSEGVSFRPPIRGQFSGVVDTVHFRH